jgi:hypothetical protein
MKTTFRLSTVLLLLFAFIFDSCKKGENDPAISLRSRKARVAGEWKLTAGTRTSVSGSPSTTTTTTYNGTTMQTTVTSSLGTTVGDATGYTETIEMDKDGNFTYTVVDDGNTDIYKGTWNFTGGVGETKNKSQIMFNITNITSGGSTSSYTGTDALGDIVVVVDELRNKKMVWKTDGTSTPAGGSVSTETGTMTYEQ